MMQESTPRLATKSSVSCTARKHVRQQQHVFDAVVKYPTLPLNTHARARSTVRILPLRRRVCTADRSQVAARQRVLEVIAQSRRPSAETQAAVMMPGMTATARTSACRDSKGTCRRSNSWPPQLGICSS